MAMAERRADVIWEGGLVDGRGRFTVGSGALGQQEVTWASRTEQPGGKTSPEELIAAAHASCYAMAFSYALANAGKPPTRLNVNAVCELDRKPEGGVKVSRVRLSVTGVVPGMDQATFEQLARTAEQNCPVSNALRNNVEISLSATLQST